MTSDQPRIEQRPEPLRKLKKQIEAVEAKLKEQRLGTGTTNEETEQELIDLKDQFNARFAQWLTEP